MVGMEFSSSYITKSERYSDMEANPMSNYEKFEKLHKAMINLDNLYAVWAKKFEITKTELCILDLLIKEEGITHRKIADSTGIAFSTLNSAIKKLVEEGNVDVSPNPSNKKEKFLSLTEQGKGYSENIIDPLVAIEEETSEKLNEVDIFIALECIKQYTSLLKSRFEE